MPCKTTVVGALFEIVTGPTEFPQVEVAIIKNSNSHDSLAAKVRAKLVSLASVFELLMLLSAVRRIKLRPLPVAPVAPVAPIELGQAATRPIQGGAFLFPSGYLANEFVMYAASDLNFDGDTNTADLGVFPLNWEECPNGTWGCLGDVNYDSHIVSQDIGLLL